MRVLNSAVSVKQRAICSPRVAKYFVEKSFPILDVEGTGKDKKIIFHFTELFEEVYNDAPIWIKLGVTVKSVEEKPE